MADKLDYLIYDFENIDPTNLTCFEATKASDSTNESNPNAGDGAGDAFADYQKSFGAGHQRRRLGGRLEPADRRQLQPAPGAQGEEPEPEDRCSRSAAGRTPSTSPTRRPPTPARKKLVSSCIDMFIKGNLPVQGGFGGTGTRPGIFDGIDIDWEYPGGGGHTGNHSSAGRQDQLHRAARRVPLRAERPGRRGRQDLRALGRAAGRPGQDRRTIETNKIGQYLTFGDIMTYDMHGGFEPTGPTNHQAPLYDDPSDPIGAGRPGHREVLDRRGDQGLHGR